MWLCDVHATPTPFDRDDDNLTCFCGNTPFRSGFECSDERGNPLAPDIGNGWHGHYVCNECGHVWIAVTGHDTRTERTS
jgi:hypothetical protein